MAQTDRGFAKDADGRWFTYKAPGDGLVYGRNLSSRFPGRTIAAVEIAEASGVTATSEAYSGQVASVVVSGGAIGQQGFVTLRCTLDDGQVTDLTMHFRIVAK